MDQAELFVAVCGQEESYHNYTAQDRREVWAGALDRHHCQEGSAGGPLISPLLKRLVWWQKKEDKPSESEDPSASIMNMMKELYDDGDETTRKLIGACRC